MEMSKASTFEGPRPARVDEREALLALVNFVFRVNVGRKPTIGEDWPLVYAPENLSNVMVVCEQDGEDGAPAGGLAGGKVVASTGVWTSDVVVGEVTLRVGGINCVGTLPEYRRYGFGSQVMMAAMARMRELGCHVGLLSTGITNWYRRMGWEEGASQRTYRLNRGNLALLPALRPGLTLRLVEIGNAAMGAEAAIEVNSEVAHAILHLYHQARLGATRTVARLRQLLKARLIERIVVAEAAGVPVAYLLLRENVALEWAGEAEDVLGLARAAFEALDDPNASTSQRAREDGPLLLRTLLLQTPGWQHPVATLLDARRIPYHMDYLGMLYLVDPQRILDAYGVDSVLLEGEGDAFVVRHGDETLLLDRRQLTKLFFGPERMRHTLPEIFPLPFWQWLLEKV